MSHHTLEYDIELGKRNMYCTILIEYDFIPREPEVRYTRNGDGHPGFPAHVEVCEVQVTTAEIAEEVLNREELAKIGGGGWLRLLDELVRVIIEKDCDESGTYWEAMMSNATGEEYD